MAGRITQRKRGIVNKPINVFNMLAYGEIMAHDEGKALLIVWDGKRTLAKILVTPCVAPVSSSFTVESTRVLPLVVETYSRKMGAVRRTQRITRGKARKAAQAWIKETC
jgi:hypothetical protein